MVASLSPAGKAQRLGRYMLPRITDGTMRWLYHRTVHDARRSHAKVGRRGRSRYCQFAGCRQYLCMARLTDGIFWLDVYLLAGCHTDERILLQTFCTAD